MKSFESIGGDKQIVISTVICRKHELILTADRSLFR